MIPEKYEEVKKAMDGLLNKVCYSEFIYNPSIAYIESRIEDSDGAMYRIFINNADVELARFLYVHECGHVIFGHVKNMKLRMDRFLLAKIKNAYNKISIHFPNYDAYLQVFQTVLFNVVMDFEVNSRMFSQQEWDFMNERVMCLIHKKGGRGMWPQDFGYEPGLTWNEYLTLILLEPDKFFSKFRMKFLNHYAGIKKSDGTEGRIVPVQLDEEELKRLGDVEAVHEKGTFIINQKGNGFSRENSPALTVDKPEEYKDMDELYKKISEVLLTKVRKSSKKDFLYNYNRRKFGTNLILPKVREEEIKVPATLTILIDVSDSVDKNLIENFLKVFGRFKNIYRKTRFITWNTNLVGDWKINDDINLMCGGGTDIAKGIKYVKYRYSQNPNDVFFVISDFRDCLYEWKNELKDIRSKKYAVNWCTCKPEFNPGFKKIFQYIM